MEFARGTTVFGWRNQNSTNVNMIAAVYPEFESEIWERIRNPFIRPYVSPLIFVRSEKNGVIVDGEVLHVQSVDSPGYEPHIVKLSGFCEGMLGDCLKELRAVGAAAKRVSTVGFELEDAIMHIEPMTYTLGASGKKEKSALSIEDTIRTGWELEDSMMEIR